MAGSVNLFDSRKVMARDKPRLCDPAIGVVGNVGDNGEEEDNFQVVSVDFDRNLVSLFNIPGFACQFSAYQPQKL